MRFLRKRAALCGPPFSVRSGWIELSNLSGTYRGVGQSGNAWLSRALSTNTGSTATPSAYYLAFDPKDVYQSLGPHAYALGFPLRCLSTVLDM